MRGPLGYVLGVALFLLALGVTSSTAWFQVHYPYLAYLLAALATCYAAGLAPAALVACMAAVVVFFTRESPRFFNESSPAVGSALLFAVILGCAWVLSALLNSRDRLEQERERYARLAESRDLLYREMQHRVSNNIQIVSGLLRLQSQGLADAGAKRALTEASGRIALIARIQRQLHDGAGRPSPFREFAEELLADALGAAGVQGVALDIVGGDEILHPEQATPVSLVMLECVNNALEHAFAPGQEGLVRVVLEREGDNHVLTVSDNGRGLPPGFDPGAGDSLGLKIVRTMAAQLNGGFAIVAQGSGYLCTLRYPDLG